MKGDKNPLRQMVVIGKTRNVFFSWYLDKYGELPHNVDLWLIAKQLKIFSEFFDKTINHANDFYKALNEFESNTL